MGEEFSAELEAAIGKVAETTWRRLWRAGFGGEYVQERWEEELAEWEQRWEEEREGIERAEAAGGEDGEQAALYRSHLWREGLMGAVQHWDTSLVSGIELVEALEEQNEEVKQALSIAPRWRLKPQSPWPRDS